MDEEQDWPRLARAVKERRLRLGLSTRAAAMAANINRATWGSTEEEERRLSRHLWAGVERALNWAPGSIEAVLGGGEPTALTADAPARRLPVGFDLREEFERIRSLAAISCETKLDLIGEIINLYEAERAEGRPGRESRPA